MGVGFFHLGGGPEEHDRQLWGWALFAHACTVRGLPGIAVPGEGALFYIDGSELGMMPRVQK